MYQQQQQQQQQNNSNNNNQRQRQRTNQIPATSSISAFSKQQTATTTSRQSNNYSYNNSYGFSNLISPRGLLNSSRRFIRDSSERFQLQLQSKRRYRPKLSVKENNNNRIGFIKKRFLSNWLKGPGGILLLFSIVSLWFIMRTLEQFTHQTHVDERDKKVSRKFCDTSYEKMPLICAHGGVHGGVEQKNGAFPNTVPAFVAASREGFECVEVDVSRTKDNELVCLHSRELKAITNNKFDRVQDLTLEHIRMHANKKGVHVATFKEVLDQVINRGFKQVTIDVKDDAKSGWSGLPEQILETVFGTNDDSRNYNNNNKRHNTHCEECVFWGKTDAMLRKFIEFDGGKHKVGYTVANFSRELRDEGYSELSTNRPLGAYCVAIQSEMAEEEKLVRDANEKLGLKTFAWTVSDARRVRKLANNNIDGIVTDEPLIVRNVFEKMRRDCLRGQHHVRDERL